MRSPLLLGQICSHWRTVAYCLTPRLWENIHVSLRDHCTEEGFYLIQDWLARAGPWPGPSIAFDSVGSNDPLAVITSLIGPLSGLRGLSLTLPHQYLTLLAAIPSTFISSLQEFNLAYDRENTHHPFAWHGYNPLSLKGCHRLRKITLWTPNVCNYIGDGFIEDVPWAQLEHLRLVDSDNWVETAREIFVQCTNLVTCNMKLAGVAPEETDPPYTFETIKCYNPNLCSLHLQFHDDISAFFQPLELPKLEWLTLERYSTQGLTEWLFPMETLIALDQRSRFSLRHLRLCYIHFDSTELVVFLSRLPSLEVLELVMCDVLSDTLVLALTDSPFQTSILPKLKQLVLSDYNLFIQDELVLDLVESRWWPIPEGTSLLEVPCQLETVVVDREYRMRRPTASAIERAQLLVDNGLHFTCDRLTRSH